MTIINIRYFGKAVAGKVDKGADVSLRIRALELVDAPRSAWRLGGDCDVLVRPRDAVEETRLAHITPPQERL